MEQIRQGDVWIERCEAIPPDAKKVRPGERGYVLAEGEATGHAHSIEETAAVELYERHGVLYCKVVADAAVRHQEHAAVTLAPGVYRIRRQIVGGWVDARLHFADPERVAD